MGGGLYPGGGLVLDGFGLEDDGGGEEGYGCDVVDWSLEDGGEEVIRSEEGDIFSDGGCNDSHREEEQSEEEEDLEDGV